MSEKIHIDCPRCGDKLKITVTPWSEQVQRERERHSRLVKAFGDYLEEVKCLRPGQTAEQILEDIMEGRGW
jgi:hypothetical protein